jgi:hypothetical protein
VAGREGKRIKYYRTVQHALINNAIQMGGWGVVVTLK